MPSRSRSPEKRQVAHARDIALDQVRGGTDAASRRFDRGNPQTPPTQRFASSTYSSPGSILGREEDVIIIELTPRFLLAGIEGESSPQCRIDFNPDHDRRTGDYRHWLIEHERAQEDIKSWGSAYELWRNEIDHLDLDLLSDRLERSIQEVYNKYLLIDAGLARVVLVLPSLVPHPVLDATLSTLFQRWSIPSITLLPAPTMAAFAAGLRSALVIDVGWEETSVTVIYEYRELQTCRSTRAMKMVTIKLAEALLRLKLEQKEGQHLRFDAEFVEEVLTRTLPTLSLDRHDNDQPGDIGRSHDPKDFAAEGHSADLPASNAKPVEIDWPSTTSSHRVRIPHATIAVAVEEGLLTGVGERYADDDEMAVSSLAFEALLGLSADARSVCISRIVFTGHLSDHAGFKSRVLRGIDSQIRANGWSSIKGSRLKSQRYGLTELAQVRGSPADTSHSIAPESGKDYVEDTVQQAKAKRIQSAPVAAGVREVASLGSWAGASLLTSLKVKGFVEIEKDRYMAHGISGANRTAEISVVAQPQRMSSFGLPKANKGQDRTSWTLAGWG